MAFTPSPVTLTLSSPAPSATEQWVGSGGEFPWVVETVQFGGANLDRKIWSFQGPVVTGGVAQAKLTIDKTKPSSHVLKALVTSTGLTLSLGISCKGVLQPEPLLVTLMP